MKSVRPKHEFGLSGVRVSGRSVPVLPVARICQVEIEVAGIRAEGMDGL